MTVSIWWMIKGLKKFKNSLMFSIEYYFLPIGFWECFLFDCLGGDAFVPHKRGLRQVL